MRSRPGKGSRKPANVKLRPVVAEGDRARARKKGTGRNAKDDGSSDAEEEDEEDRLAREQFAVDDEEEHGAVGDLGKGEDKKPLEGMMVCSSGTLEQPKENMTLMCAALGATFEQVLTTETTFLLADATGSDKYKACVENGIPVLRSAFLTELHRRWLEVIPFDIVALSNAYRLSPLQDLTICLTGYGNDRNHHRNTIAACGGAAYSPELSSEVTHLVVGPDYQSREELLTNGKYLCAKQINSKRAKRQDSRRQIWIVWGEWLEHSLCAFGRVREEPYSAEIVPNREEITPPHGEASPDIIARRNSASPRKMRKHRPRDDHAQIKSKRKLITQETLPSMDGAEASSRKRAAEDEEPAIQSKKAKKEPEAETSRMQEVVGDLNEEDPNTSELLEPAAVKKPSTSLSTGPLQAAQRERSASIAPRQSMKKQQSSTHLELLGVQELLTIKQEQTSQVVVTALASVTTSEASLVRKPEDHFFAQSEAMPVASGSLLAKMGKDRSNKFISSKQKDSVSAEPEASTSQLLSKHLPSMQTMAATTSAANQTNVSALEEEEDALPPSLIFSGMTFYIVPGEFENAVVPRICQAITDRGGAVADCDNAEVDVVLCKTISSTPASFDLQDPRVFTSDWLEACMAEDEIPRDIPLFEALKQPLRCVLPLPGLAESKTSVSYSGFDIAHERPKLTRALDLLGIPHEPVVYKKDVNGKLKTTHIIIPDQSYRSERLGIAQAWGIQVVLPGWICEQALLHALPSTVPKQEIDLFVEDFKMESSDTYRMQYDELSSDGPDSENKPLSNCRIHVSRKLKDWRELEKQATRVGARLVQVLDADMAKSATHLIFQSNQAKSAGRDYALALQNKVKIVHPDWLRHTAEKGLRQPEGSYKHTRNSKRGLEVIIESQSMSRGSSSSSAKSIREVPTSDDLDLPPPLKKLESTPGLAFQSLSQVAPRSIRSPQPPSSPPRKDKAPSSSATVASTPERSQGSALGERSVSEVLVTGGGPDDSGFVPSAGKPKADSRQLMATSSDPGIATEFQEKAVITSTARDIMAEMQALMQADVTPQQLNVGLPRQQQAGYQGRTSMRKSIGRNGETPAPSNNFRSPGSSNVDGTTLVRQQAYNHYVETQFGQIRSDDTQTQAGQEEHTMIIRINDPVAEATKAKLLAGIRSVKSGESSTDNVQDSEATQRSTEETAARSSRSSGRKR